MIIVLLGLHWVADFVLQSHNMALNKSKSFKWLGIHCGVYAIVFVFISPLFALVNGVIHFMVDAVTSRMTARHWKRNDPHNFFVIVGFDQFIHIVTLLWTFRWLMM